jgi:hypothetical protein
VSEFLTWLAILNLVLAGVCIDRVVVNCNDVANEDDAQLVKKSYKWAGWFALVAAWNLWAGIDTVLEQGNVHPTREAAEAWGAAQQGEK